MLNPSTPRSRTRRRVSAAIIIAVLLAGVALPLVVRRGSADTPPPATVQARVTLDGVTPAAATVDAYVNFRDQKTGVWKAQMLPGTVPGKPSAWFAIDGAVKGRFSPVPVHAKGVTAMRVTLEVDNGAGQIQVSRDTVAGSSALFFATMAPEGTATLVTSASETYRQGLDWAREVAVPENERPRRFVISDYIIGPGPSTQALDDGLQTLALLGINTAQISNFTDLNARVAPLARQYGITRFRRAVYGPPAYFAWDAASIDTAKANSWATEQALTADRDGTPAAQVALFHLADEPGWYFPEVLGQMAETPERLEKFRAFLRAQGLQSADVGGAAWTDIKPIAASQVKDLPTRRLYYWTAQYPALMHSDAMQTWTAALRRNLNPNVLVASNWNNWVSRYFLPSPGAKVGNNKDIGPDAAMGMPNWMDMGRKGGVSALWTEDWTTDLDAQLWTYYADVMRSAVRPSGVEFGGYIVGRRLGGVAAGGKLKALALVGHGAKALEWYAYGPAPLFPGNGYSDRRESYAGIAGANRLIGRAEELLYPGRPTPARIAIVTPVSAQVWDKSMHMPMYQREMIGIHYALTHSHYPVDFVDEDDLARGRFNGVQYDVLYITAPNLNTAAQRTVGQWVAAGGTAVFSPGAAAADEYNTPVDLLDAARGLRGSVWPRRIWSEDAATRVPITFNDRRYGSDASVNGQAGPLEPTDGQTIATLPGGGTALVTHRHGKGQCLSYGFWPAQAYYISARRTYPGHLPIGWSDALRSIVNAGPRLARVKRPVDVDTPGVEAARLDSKQGIALTLLNWLDEPQEQVALTIRGAGTVSGVSSAQRGQIQYSRSGDDLLVTLPLDDVDVVMVRH